MSPTQEQIDKALKAGYTMDQINKEIATPGTVKRSAIMTPATPSYAEQNIIAPNVTGMTPTRTTPPPATGGTTGAGTTTPTMTNGAGFRSNPVNNLGNVGGTTPTTTTTPPVPGTLNIKDLSPELQNIYNTDPYAKAAFDMAAKAGEQQWQEAIDKYTAIVKNNQAQSDYLKKTAENQQAQNAITQSANVRNLQAGIERADTNLHYASGSSAVSSVATTAVGKQMQALHQQLADYIALNNLQNDHYSDAVAEQMRQIEVNLQQQIGKTLYDALNSLDQGVDTGHISTDEELEAMFQKNSEALLRQVPSLSQNAFNQMNSLMDGFIRQQDKNREMLKNNFAVNKDISAASGILTNMNGSPILDANGNQIMYPEVTPFDPINLGNGQILIGSYDDYGNIVTDLRTLSGYQQKETTGGQVWQKLDDNTLYNQATGETKPVGGTSTPTGTYKQPIRNANGTYSWNQSSKYQMIPTNDGGIQVNAQVGTSGGQCGRFVNDFLGIPSFFVDPIDMKAAKMNSNSPEVGSIAIMDIIGKDGKPSPYGHVAVVEKVAPNGDITVMDSNWGKDEKISRHVIKKGSAQYNQIRGYYDPALEGAQQSQGMTPTDNSILTGLATKLLETGGLEPKDITSLGYSMQEFRKIAPDLYIQGKNAQFNGLANITNKEAFLAATPKMKNDVIDGVAQTQILKNQLEEYRQLIKDNGGEVTTWSKAGKQLDQLKNDMALTLKEVKNLGVLNGKDYEILLTQIPTATGISATAKNFLPFMAKISDSVDSFEKSLNNSISTQLGKIGVSYGDSSSSANPQDVEALRTKYKY